ncbi:MULTISPECIES: peroxiredoxin [unclassified Bradyrhizobium]|uniref:peroxiredoxin n=1 Tax=unclassified Bradyrhizobium TaxID=2631580 RepID=UPI000A04CAF3|nr:MULTISPECIES: redoxin domain-containing protein [unclassified Bradyrhizobium]MCP3466318.1 redoxin domain-containing protein [Bradyrhizobium sp. CCGUVB23]
MSKKTRKKSSKTASGSPTPRKKRTQTRTMATTKPARTQRAATRKSTKTSTVAASHKATSKRLKSSESTAAPAKGTKGALSEGQKAPAFSLPRDGGGVARLADYSGKKLVLFFYPRADTPGCTREAIDFTRLKDAFAATGTSVLGISADPQKAQEKFRDKHKLAVPLISDEQHEMLEAYGAWGEKSMYGRTFLGILRTTVLVGADGKVARIWRNVRVDGHAEDVLAAATSL